MTSIEEIYKNFLRKKVESGSRRHGIHVSDLVSECLRKPWYRMAGLEKQIDEDSVTAFYYGTTIHESFNGMFEVMEFPLYVDPFQDIALDEDYKPENKFHAVSGSLDAIANNDTIVDFKTCSKLPSSPSIQYMDQINFYSYMYFTHTGIEIKKGAILYLEKSSGFKNYKVLEFNLNDPETNRLIMCKRITEIETDEPPVRVPTPLCTVCPFLESCKPVGYFNYIEKRYIFR